MAVFSLGLSSGCAIEAREISRALGERWQDLDVLIVGIGYLTDRLTAMTDPLPSEPGFIELQLELRRMLERLQRSLARSRYTYDVGEEPNG